MLLMLLKIRNTLTIYADGIERRCLIAEEQVCAQKNRSWLYVYAKERNHRLAEQKAAQ